MCRYIFKVFRQIFEKNVISHVWRCQYTGKCTKSIKKYGYSLPPPPPQKKFLHYILGGPPLKTMVKGVRIPYMGHPWNLKPTTTAPTNNEPSDLQKTQQQQQEEEEIEEEE